MLTIITLGIAFTMPFIFVRLFMHDDDAIAYKLIGFGVGAFLALCAYALMTLFVMTFTEHAYVPQGVERTYVASDVAVSSLTKKNAVLLADGEEVKIGRANVVVSTASDDENIENEIEHGNTVIEVWKESCPLTLFEKKTYRVYTPPESAALYTSWVGDEDAEDED